jgi:hypothetical protein
MSKGIHFPDGSQWVATSKNGALALASRPDIEPLTMRILFAAQYRADRDGHAPFAPGELREILQSVNKRTGAIRSATPVAVRKAIRRAEMQGIVTEESEARCLVLSGMFQRGDGPALPCIHVNRGRPKATLTGSVDERK